MPTTQTNYRKRINNPAITAHQNKMCWSMLSKWLDMQTNHAGTIDQLKVVTCPNPGFVVYAINNNWLIPA